MAPRTMREKRATELDLSLEEAELFLAALNLDRELETFQTFDEVKDRKNAKLARIFHGDLRDHAEDLKRLNRLGAGVFVALNVTDGKGRTKDSIKKVRALCLDLDGASIEPVRTCALSPHLIVETSPGHYHAYWLVRNFPLDQFEDTQRSLAKKFDGDPAIALLTHVARLPGFDHCKGERFRVRIIHMAERLKSYHADAIIDEFPPEKRAHKAPTSRVILRVEAPLDSACCL